MHQSEVEKQLREDHEKFINEPYNKSVPENLIALFEQAIMVVPPQAHGINFSKVKSIIEKTPEELNKSDINDIIKLVFNTPLQVFYDGIFDAVPEHAKLEKFVLKFQNHLNEFNERLNQKRTRLASLSDGILNKNGMKIITNGQDY